MRAQLDYMLLHRFHWRNFVPLTILLQVGGGLFIAGYRLARPYDAGWFNPTDNWVYAISGIPRRH